MLYQLGVRHVCISPGARNSPLTYAFTEKSEITSYSHVDERSSAFFALGLAKSTQNPVILVSTSGTAAANFYPAVIEASLSRVPLIILSADRPDYLVGTGANQTINQQNLYGSHIRYFMDVGLPNNKFDLLKDKLETAFQHSAGLTLKYPSGPVHLNFPFNEPLMPDHVQNINFPLFPVNDRLKPKLNLQIPILTEAKRPLIVVGPMEENIYQEDIIQLAEKIKAPIFSDPISQLRCGFYSQFIIAHYDIFLRYIDIQPDIIIRFGRKPTSKVLCNLLDNWAKNTILVDAWHQYNDDCPNFIQSPIGSYCMQQFKKLKWEGSTDWVNKLLSCEKTVENEIQLEMGFHEGVIAKTCFKSIKSGGQFIIGNSMPIRDVDMFTSSSKKKIATFCNRGASGIDGVISTALGICADRIDSHSLLLIGDLSFYHDMNGLLAAKYGMNLTIVVINNSGGGMFSFLPIAKAGMEKYEQYWITNTNLHFEKVAELYNCAYCLANNLPELENYIQENINKNGVKIIEVKTVINENITAHRNFLKKVKQSFSDR